MSTIQKTPGGEISEILQGAQSYRFQVERHKILINDTETKSFTTAITFSVQLQMQPFIPNLTLRHTGSDLKKSALKSALPGTDLTPFLVFLWLQLFLDEKVFLLETGEDFPFHALGYENLCEVS